VALKADGGGRRAPPPPLEELTDIFHGILERSRPEKPPWERGYPLSDLEPRLRRQFDPGYIAPPLFGAPGLLLPPPLAEAAATYSIRPEWLAKMAQVPVVRSSPQILGQKFGWGAYSPFMGGRLYLPREIEPPETIHEYAHAMQAQGAAPGFEQQYQFLKGLGMPPGITKYWAWRDPGLAALAYRMMPGAETTESYAEYPERYGRGEPVPSTLQRFYPWLDLTGPPLQPPVDPRVAALMSFGVTGERLKRLAERVSVPLGMRGEFRPQATTAEPRYPGMTEQQREWLDEAYAVLWKEYQSRQKTRRRK